MHIRYRFHALSESEQEFLVAVLFMEMDMQSWFAITVSRLLQDEVFLLLN